MSPERNAAPLGLGLGVGFWFGIGRNVAPLGLA